MSDHISIASFDAIEPAQILAGRLSAEGIPAIADSDAAEQLLRFYNPHPRAHCHVLVPKANIATALQRIKELDESEGLLKSAVRCPQCHSSQVEFPQFSRNTIIGAMPSIAAAAGLIDREFYCVACHFTWPPAVDPATEIPAGKGLL